MLRDMFVGEGKLLGEFLRELSPLARWQIVEGLREQVIGRDRGVDERIGDILVRRGYVEQRELERALALQNEDRHGRL